MDKMIYLISLFQTFWQIVKGGLVVCLQNNGRDVYLDYKKRKESFTYHFRSDCNNVCLMILASVGYSFDDWF
jgi:hypothetical protein